MTKFSVARLSPEVGAEIRGLDLSRPLETDTIVDINNAWLEHLVLVFRCGPITEKEQARFAAYFGKTVGAHVTQRKDGGDRRLMLISNIRENGKPIGALPDGELMFHSDSAFIEKPLKGTILYAEEVTSAGGHTLFANMYQVYDVLPKPLRTKLTGLQAVNIFDYKTLVKSVRFDRNTSPHAVHPAVRTHPETGRKALYVNRLMTEELVGIAPKESDAMLEELFKYVENSDHIYEHVWEVNDLVMWDNRCTQHARTDFPAKERRLLRRVGIEGDRPF